MLVLIGQKDSQDKIEATHQVPSSPREDFCWGRIHPEGFVLAIAPSLIFWKRLRTAEAMLVVVEGSFGFQCGVWTVFSRADDDVLNLVKELRLLYAFSELAIEGHLLLIKIISKRILR
jgi:hypothetical protein